MPHLSLATLDAGPSGVLGRKIPVKVNCEYYLGCKHILLCRLYLLSTYPKENYSSKLFLMMTNTKNNVAKKKERKSKTKGAPRSSVCLGSSSRWDL